MKRTIALLMAVTMLLSAFSFSASAEESKRVFKDVPEGKWYYDAVYYCVENNLFSGTSETTFSPNSGMTRAMFVTVLASKENVDKTQYTTSSFSDVPTGKWYSASIEWAYRNDLVGGVGNGKFAPDKTVTRQELVAMIYKYAAFIGHDMTKGENLDITGYSDYSTVSEWAIPGFKWAVKNGIVSGVLSGEDVLLAPKNTATRATVAVIMRSLCSVEVPSYADPGNAKMTINGNSITEYRIVKPANCYSKVSDAAVKLQEFIKTATGVELEIVTDEQSEQTCEILVGQTNREKEGDIPRDEMNDLEFTVRCIGDKLYLAGAKDEKKRNATYYAPFFFAEKELGFSFFQDDCIICVPDSDINIDDGYSYNFEMSYESRSIYMQGAWEDVFLNEDYYSGVNWVHELYNWVYGGDGDYNKETPCLSKEANIQKIIEKTKELFDANPGRNAVWVSMNDSDQYCQCDACMAAYREDGTRAATIVRLCNRVSEAIEEDYPGKTIFTLAYNYAIKPPKKTVPADNIVPYYCMISNCYLHPYNDPSCSMNVASCSNVQGWGAISKKMYVWDYSADFSYCMIPFANLYSMYDNVKWFYDNGVRGLFINAVDKSCGEFTELRGYLWTRLMYNPNITREEYFDHINSFIRNYYGDKELYLRRYIDIIEELTERQDVGFNAPVNMTFNYDEVIERIDEIEALWAGAFEEAKGNAEYTERVDCSYSSWLYLKQCATYSAYYLNGTDAQKNQYITENKRLYDRIMKYDIGLKEGTDSSSVRYDQGASPDRW